MGLAGPDASPESVTEILALISHPNQGQFHLLDPFRCRFTRCGVDQPLGRDAPPFLHPARTPETLSLVRRFDDIDIDVPLGELLVEASKGTPHWRVMLTPLPGAAGEPDSQSTPGWGDRVI